MARGIYTYRIFRDGVLIDSDEVVEVRAFDDLLAVWSEGGRQTLFDLAPGQPFLDTYITPIAVFSYKTTDGDLITFRRDRLVEEE